MKCQHCGTNEATMNLRIQVNQQGMQMSLCHTCFQEIQGQLTEGKKPVFNSDANHYSQANGNQQDADANETESRHWVVRPTW